ncbi:MAG: hypothetical protein WCT77_10290 [Bacteroidota bacterium]|jgi:hypothetical protein
MEIIINTRRLFLKIAVTFIFVVITLVINGCWGEQDETNPVAPPPSDCNLTNISFATDIKPHIEADCASCHGGSVTLGGITLITYADIKAAAQNGKIVKSLNGSMAEMASQKGSKLSCYILQIQAWVNNGAPDN